MNDRKAEIYVLCTSIKNGISHDAVTQNLFCDSSNTTNKINFLHELASLIEVQQFKTLRISQFY